MASHNQGHNPSDDDIPIHHKVNMRNVVMRQTDYDEDTADDKLAQHKYDIMAVVSEYINPNKVIAENNDNVVESVNQKIYGEIRGMMDNASWRYRKDKERQETEELIRSNYIKHINIANRNIVSKVNTKIEE